MQKETYARALGNKTLSGSAVGDLLAFIESRGMKVEDLPAEILHRARYRSNLKFGSPELDRPEGRPRPRKAQEKEDR
ncbi:MAG: hypothetical protein SCM96_15625 [Acidobacteriota bacterium]|nr:hypothetical protein [Acidobacteriota bacterium]